MVGESLGPYKILEPLGAGGMGEVYLGEDTRLGRKVAIKVLPAEFASDPERLARFEQEARAAAALNHPHIAVVHDVGSEQVEDGSTTHFMVQEYLEGQSLREHLDTGPLPLHQALDLATEIAAALVAAHKAGIVHRDLKPDNMFVTQEGHAKVLDFGLAKLIEVAAPAGSELSMSPTMVGTVAGQVMGTAGYMAPEQVNGEEVDQRADLFAFGCVLYGMVTGRQAFGGKNVHETLGRILSDEPDSIGTINSSLPQELQRVVRKLLAKEPGRRYQTASDLSVDLRQLKEDVVAGLAIPFGSDRELATVGATQSGQSASWWAVAPALVAALIFGGAITWWATRPAPSGPERLIQFDVSLPEGGRFAFPGRTVVAISPDGRRLALVSRLPTGVRQILIHRFDDPEAIAPLPGAERALSPFFSPSGEDLGFWDSENGMISRVPLAGGLPRTLVSADRLYGASWAEDGWIYYGQGEKGIWRVPQDGGEAKNVFPVADGERASGPQLLPGGEWVLFTVSQGMWNGGSVVAQSIISPDQRIEVVPMGRHGRWLSTGHITYVRDGALYGIAYDLEEMETTSIGEVPLLVGIAAEDGLDAAGIAQYTFTSSGDLVYVPEGALGTAPLRTLAWIDREDGVDELPFPPKEYFTPRLSPDKNRIAVNVASDSGSRVHIMNLTSSTSRPLTSEGEDSRAAVWSLDGEWVYFSANSGGNFDIFKQRADGSGEAIPVYQERDDQWATSISDDNVMIFESRDTEGRAEAWTISLDDESEKTLVGAIDHGRIPYISPDGRYFAFGGLMPGGGPSVEVWGIGSGEKHTISTGRGSRPIWSADGRSVFYRVPRAGISVVEVSTDPTFFNTQPEIAFAEAPGMESYPEVSPDGQRVLAALARPRSGTEQADFNPGVIVILNWFEELKRQVPTGR